jgi:N-formylglutamate amidohydrolase
MPACDSTISCNTVLRGHEARTHEPMKPPDPEHDPPFEMREPSGPCGAAVFSSPHSGRIYPRRFLGMSRLSPVELRRSEDAFLDVVFANVVERGAPFIHALFPRAYLDLNREPYELDPRMFTGRLPAFANTRSMRVAGGLGTLPRLVADGKDIYASRLSVDEAIARIEALHRPYHAALRRLLMRAHRRHGAAILVDCHSMPSTGPGRESAWGAEIVLGDRYGTSCAPAVIDSVESLLRRMGYRVARNKPYAGGFITEHYGEPAAGFHALQIEICRALYMDERRIEPHAGLGRLSADLVRIADALAELDLSALTQRPLAAE